MVKGEEGVSRSSPRLSEGVSRSVCLRLVTMGKQKSEELNVDKIMRGGATN
jgi:hypothetical protein